MAALKSVSQMYPLLLNSQQTAHLTRSQTWPKRPASLVTLLESKSRGCNEQNWVGGNTATTNNLALSPFSALEFLLKDPSTAQQQV